MPQEGSAVQLIVMHAGGDVPVVPVLGWVQDRVHNWRYVFASYHIYAHCPGPDPKIPVQDSMQGLHIRVLFFSVTMMLWCTREFGIRTHHRAARLEPRPGREAYGVEDAGAYFLSPEIWALITSCVQVRQLVCMGSLFWYAASVSDVGWHALYASQLCISGGSADHIILYTSASASVLISCCCPAS